MKIRFIFMGILILCASEIWGETFRPYSSPTTEDIIQLLSTGSPDEVAVLLKSEIDVNQRVTEKNLSLLMVAAASNPQEEVISLLLAAGANINCKNNEGTNVLQIACESNPNPKVIDSLIKTKINIDERDYDGCTALMYAASGASKSTIIDLLLNAGADISKKDYSGKTALMYAAGWNPNVAILESLITEKSKIYAKLDTDENSRESVSSYIAYKLAKENGVIDEKDKEGKTALMYAAGSNSNVAIINTLIKAKATIEAKDFKGNTALMYAKKNNAKSEIISALLKAGALNIEFGTLKIECQLDGYLVRNGQVEFRVYLDENYLGEAPGQFEFIPVGRHRIRVANSLYPEVTANAIVEFNKTSTVLVPITSHAKLEAQKEEVIRKIFSRGSENEIEKVLNNGLDINKAIGNNNESLFMIATRDNPNENAIILLLCSGANLNSVNNDGSDALMLACESNNNPKVIDALLLSNMSPNKQDNDGCNALMYAGAGTSKPEIIARLIKAGANLEATDKEGKTALMYAAGSNPNVAVLKALIDVTSQINREDLSGKTALIYAIQANAKSDIISALMKAGAKKFEFGTLKIECKSDGNLVRPGEITFQVYLGETRIGSAPGQLQGLPVGSNKIRLVHELYPEKTATVIINKNTPSSIMFEMFSTDYLNKIDLNRRIRVLSSGCENDVKKILNHDFDINKVAGKKNETFFMIAARDNPNENIIKLLLSKGPDLNLTNSDGATALMLASESNSNPKVIKALLFAKAEVNRLDNDGCSALMYAASGSSKPEITQLLINAGAAVENVDNKGRTALMYAALHNPNVEICKILMNAQINQRKDNYQTAYDYSRSNPNKQISKAIFKSLKELLLPVKRKDRISKEIDRLQTEIDDLDKLISGLKDTHKQYVVYGEIRDARENHSTNLEIWGVAMREDGMFAQDEINIVVVNPDKEKIYGSTYWGGIHYYLSKSYGTNAFGGSVPIYYYGDPPQKLKLSLLKFEADKKKISELKDELLIVQKQIDKL